MEQPLQEEPVKEVEPPALSKESPTHQEKEMSPAHQESEPADKEKAESDVIDDQEEWVFISEDAV